MIHVYVTQDDILLHVQIILISSITCACVKLLFYFLYYVNEESFIDVIFTAATHNEWHVKLQQMITPVNEIDRNPRK